MAKTLKVLKDLSVYRVSLSIDMQVLKDLKRVVCVHIYKKRGAAPDKIRFCAGILFRSFRVL